jgi:hypothetical protein
MLIADSLVNKETKKLKRALLFAFVCLVCSPLAVSAQNRKRTVPKKTTTTTTTQPSAASVRADKEQVGNHIKNLTRFIYLLGGVAKGIEEVDAAAKQGQVSQATINTEKGKLVASIANWRIAMDDLEITFRTKTQLQKFFPKVSGVGQVAATAEDQARAGRFSQSGQTLLQVISRLTDVMLEMP